ncbi:MAG: hypothetical protein JSS83_17365 [Cyanobacteria bacterium SZAS LIN-3]|nr:hypothetical protein [Cyanobacteria bacterium SZAS LIN-3]
MRRRFLPGASAFLFAATFALTFAVPSSQGAGVDGVQQRQKVTELTKQLTWFDNMPQALACARQRGKPLVWIHMLGKIDGAT